MEEIDICRVREIQHALLENGEEKKRLLEKPTTPLKAIRAHCIECAGGSKKGVAQCPMEFCFLYPFRMGKNPFIEGK